MVLNTSLLSTKRYCNISTSKNTTKIWICEIYIGNPKTLETLTSLFGSGTKLFITFLRLRFFDKRRERHNFFLCWLFVYRQLSTHWLNKRAAHFVDPQLVSPRRAPKINLLRPSPNLNSLFFFNSKIFCPSLLGMMPFTPRSYFLSGVFIVTSLIVTSTSRAREHLHSMCAPN